MLLIETDQTNVHCGRSKDTKVSSSVPDPYIHVKLPLSQTLNNKIDPEAETSLYAYAQFLIFNWLFCHLVIYAGKTWEKMQTCIVRHFGGSKLTSKASARKSSFNQYKSSHSSTYNQCFDVSVIGPQQGPTYILEETYKKDKLIQLRANEGNGDKVFHSRLQILSSKIKKIYILYKES